MATFVDNIAEQEQSIELARFINKIKAKGKEPNETFVQEVEKLAETEPRAVVSKLLGEANLVITEGSDREVESYFFVLLSLAKKVGQEAVPEVTSKIISVVSANPLEKSLLRLRILNHLYNIINNGSTRFTIFLELIKLANASKNVVYLVQIFKERDFEDRMSEWGITPVQKRELYRNIRDLLKESTSSHAYSWSLKYLRALDGASDAELSAAVDDAAAVVVESIKQSDMYQFDALQSYSAVKKLENHPKHGATFQLLKIFTNESLEGYRTFADKHKDFFNQTGLNQEECLRKMRLLTLATLANGQTEIPFSHISKALQVGENEVELWIISGISDNLISGKMDQLKRTVYVNYALQRVFTKDQWKQLATNLEFWRNGISAVLDTIQQAKKSSQEQHIALAKAIQQQS